MRIKYISLLAALAAAPAISLAVESAVATDRASLPLIPLSSAIKAPAPNLATSPAHATKASVEDPFRETDVWNRIRTGFWLLSVALTVAAPGAGLEPLDGDVAPDVAVVAWTAPDLSEDEVHEP